MVKVLQLLGWVTITAALLNAIWFHSLGPEYDYLAIYVLVGGAVSAVLWFSLATILRNQEKILDVVERLQRR